MLFSCVHVYAASLVSCSWWLPVKREQVYSTLASPKATGFRRPQYEESRYQNKRP